MMHLVGLISETMRSISVTEETRTKSSKQIKSERLSGKGVWRLDPSRKRRAVKTRNLSGYC